MNKNKKNPKGFTLIELLIVIAILVILAVVVILTLNPAQLLAQARDSQRMSDMSTLKSAISLFLADVSTTTPNCGLGTSSATTIYISAPSSITTSSVVDSRFPSSSTSNTLITTSSAPGSITGTGWIPIAFNAISSGAPIGREPIDPVNTTITGSSATSTSYYYGYGVGSTGCTFELNAHMESSRYQNGGSNDVESKDGGNDPYSYQTGTNINL
jgi:prepilin-type N-terminal cleavage/methylation domain-containing protein